ncbi:MAG TPA: GNAT family N-acetyltransferase [Gemmatimonadaceae bacterium]|nr:GNAT family N-acetyltransferase [Gemmatimonadaceae bacterium]
MTTGEASERYDRIFSGHPPSLESTRLILRPFVAADAADVERLAGDFQVAKTLLSMPHPYPPGAALEWISKHDELWRARKEVPFAIARRDRGGALSGAIALHFALDHHHAEVGYWIARASWGDGVASEATRAVLQWAFTDLELHRVFARHMATNPASGAVMRRNGMRQEGTLRQHHWKHGRHHDFHVYGILRAEFLAAQTDP